jgi:hypothetical protein
MFNVNRCATLKDLVLLNGVIVLPAWNRVCIVDGRVLQYVYKGDCVKFKLVQQLLRITLYD